MLFLPKNHKTGENKQYPAKGNQNCLLMTNIDASKRKEKNKTNEMVSFSMSTPNRGFVSPGNKMAVKKLIAVPKAIPVMARLCRFPR